MHTIVPTLLLICLLTAAIPAYAASKPRSFEGSVRTRDYSAGVEEEDADRGVIGIRYVVRLGYTCEAVVQKVVKGGPADVAGIKRGDKIIAVDGKETCGLDRSAIARLIRGEPGTAVIIAVERKGERINLTAVRGGLTKLQDNQFKADMRVQENTELRDTHIIALGKALMIDAATRASEATPSAVPLRDRMLAKDQIDEARFKIEAGDYPAAVGFLRRALKFDPQYSETQFLYALLLDKVGKTLEAEEVLTKLSVETPKRLEVWQILASCREQLAKYEDAIAALKQCAKLTSDRKEELIIRQKISELQDRAKTPQAIHTEVALIAARVAMEAKDYDTAISKLEAAIAEDPSQLDAWKMLGVCAQIKDDYPKAIHAFSEYLKLSAENPPEDSHLADIYLALGVCQRTNGSDNDAISSFEACLKNNPTTVQSFAAWQLLASAQLRRGKFGDAIDSFRKAIQVAPDNPDAKDLNDIATNLQADFMSTNIGTASGDNYFSAVKQGGFSRWVKRKPLRVYIPDGEGKVGYSNDFPQIVKDAFAQWSTISDGHYSFEFVNSPKKADIVWVWVDSQEGMQRITHGGETQIKSWGSRIQKAEIKMLTATTQKWAPQISAKHLRTCSLHEIGHALGIDAHSSNPDDIMFPGAEVATLSERDKKTMSILYTTELPRDPAVISPSGGTALSP